MPLALILGALEVSLILIKVEIPTTGPVIDVSLILIRNLSVPSVTLSLETVTSIDPSSLKIWNGPDRELLIKSDSLIVPSISSSVV